MKIRSGFVSNSSSSSFIIIGKKLNYNEVTIEMLKEKNIMAIGPELIEGDDIFRVNTIEEFAFLRALDNLGKNIFNVVEAFVFGGDDDYSGEFDAEKLPKEGKLQFYKGYMDYSNSTDLSMLQDRYDDDGEVTRVMQRFLRAKKINKIENK